MDSKSYHDSVRTVSIYQTYDPFKCFIESQVDTPDLVLRLFLGPFIITSF